MQCLQSTVAHQLGGRLAGREVLVTGATGFIGSHLVERLVALGARVTAVGPALGWRPVVPALVKQGRVRFVKLEDFWSPDPVARVKPDLGGAEYVVHLGYAMPSGEGPLQKAIGDVHQNVAGTLRFIQQLPESVSAICYASSAMVYGSCPARPVTETDCAHPATAYAVGKLATENYLKLHMKESDVSVSIMRYATVYGPMETVPRAVPNFIRRVLSGGSPVIHGKGDDIRDYVHVQDVVDATILALIREGGPQVYNVGTGKGYTTCEIAERIIRLSGKRVKPVHKTTEHEPFKLVCDITRAQRWLGYEPKTKIDDGLLDEIRYFTNQPELWRSP